MQTEFECIMFHKIIMIIHFFLSIPTVQSYNLDNLLFILFFNVLLTPDKMDRRRDGET